MRGCADADHVDEGVRNIRKGIGPLLNPEPMQAPGKFYPALEKQIALNQSQIGRRQAGAVQRRARLHPGMITLGWFRGVGIQEPSSSFSRQAEAVGQPMAVVNHLDCSTNGRIDQPKSVDQTRLGLLCCDECQIAARAVAAHYQRQVWRRPELVVSGRA